MNELEELDVAQHMLDKYTCLAKVPTLSDEYIYLEEVPTLLDL